MPPADCVECSSNAGRLRRRQASTPRQPSAQHHVHVLPEKCSDHAHLPKAHPIVSVFREAAEKAGEHTEAALMGSLPMYVPDFKTVVMPALVVALDEWRVDAEKSECLRDAERSWSHLPLQC